MRAKLIEDAMGGVSTPGATLNNVPGAGTPATASTSATTGAQQTSANAIGSGDKWGDGPMYDQKGKIETKKKAKKEKAKKSKAGGLGESNINPYDKIGNMMAKRMGTPTTFEPAGDPATNEVKQKDFKIPKYGETPKLKNHKKTQFPSLKENEVTPREQEALKDVKAKKILDDLAISYVYKQSKSGEYRTYIKGDVNKVVDKLEELNWEVEDLNDQTKSFKKNGQMLIIVADGKDLPRVFYKDIQKETDVIESFSKKIVSTSIEPYI